MMNTMGCFKAEAQHAGQLRRPTLGGWLAAGRNPLLDFLRNLTSQVFFVALTRFTIHRLDTADIPQWKPWLVISLLMFGGLFAIGFIANASVCYEELFKEFLLWRARAVRHLRRRFPRAAENFRASFWLQWRQRRREAILASLLMIPLLLVFVAVLLAGMLAANGYIQHVTK